MNNFDLLMYFLPVVFLIVFSIIYLFFGEKSKWQQRRQKSNGKLILINHKPPEFPIIIPLAVLEDNAPGTQTQLRVL
jgi:hypothetical protein